MAAPAVKQEPERLGWFRQLVRFIGIGGVCGLLDITTYLVLLLALDLPNWVARPVAFLVGTACSFVANRRFTFGAAATDGKAGRFALVYTVAFFVSSGTNQLLVVLTPDRLFGLLPIVQYSLCWAIGQGLGTVMNFVVLRWIVFRPTGEYYVERVRESESV